MANVSFSLTGQQDAKVTNVVTGTSAPSAGDISVEINTTNVKTRKEATKLLEAIIRFINNGNVNTVFRP